MTKIEDGIIHVQEGDSLYIAVRRATKNTGDKVIIIDGERYDCGASYSTARDRIETSQEPATIDVAVTKQNP